MPQPYDYTVPQANVGSYFDAMRQGRQDRLAVETEQKQNALSKYLPGALQGDKEKQDLALQNAPVDKMAGLKAQFMQMDAPKLEAVKEFRRQGEAGAAWARNPQQWAQVQERQRAEAQRLGIPFAEIPYEQKDAFAAMGQTVDNIIDQTWKAKAHELDASRTTAQNALTYGQLNALKNKPVGNADMNLPSRQQTQEDSDIEAIQAAKTINSQLDPIIADLTTPSKDDPSQMRLDVGPGTNLFAQGQNYLGISTPNSRGIANMDSTIEALRNQILMAHKGVQTEGDANRAMAQIVKYRTDGTVVAQQLKKLKHLNEIAMRQRLQLIDVRRKRNGAPAFDPQQIALPAPGNAPTAPAAPARTPAPRAAMPTQGRGPQPGTVEGGFEFQGGDPADPNNWEPVQ